MARGILFPSWWTEKNIISIGNREWNDFCKYQLKPSSFYRRPTLGTYYLNIIMPVASDHFRSLFRRYKKKKTQLTKKINAENTTGQSSRDRALNNDNNFVT